MDKKELIDKFCTLYNEAISSNDADDTRISLHMFKKAVLLLADTNIREARDLVECYEGNLKYYNYLTESEAKCVVEKFCNQDGTSGPKWREPQTFFTECENMGMKIECEPHYNKWALYVTMNKYYSYQNNVILKWVGDDREKYFEACYALAVSQLKDKDRPYWVRWYFGVNDQS